MPSVPTLGLLLLLAIRRPEADRFFGATLQVSSGHYVRGHSAAIRLRGLSGECVGVSLINLSGQTVLQTQILAPGFLRAQRLELPHDLRPGPYWLLIDSDKKGVMRTWLVVQ
jgi:hypothetical protein